MKDKLKKIIYNLRVVLVVFISLFGITLLFINSSLLSTLICRGLNLKVDPGFVGGLVAADFFDSTNDDDGSGNLRYPASAKFPEGSLDLIRYTVHQPVYNARWQANADYWQLALEFGKDCEAVRNIMIYVGLEQAVENSKIEKLSSSTQTLFSAAENVQFTEENPWNFAVWIFGNEAKVFDGEGNLICKAETHIGTKKLYIRIPLKDKKLQQVYTAKNTYHYVLAGAYSPYDAGGFMPIEKRRSNSRGGTKVAKDFNTLIPKVYDVLGDNQQLASWDSDTLTKATVYPVKAEMNVSINSNKDEVEKLKENIYSKMKEYETDSSNNEYFGYETLDEALNTFEKAVKENPLSPIDNCHYGSCLAMKGGRSNVVQAVAYVNESFEYLDKAVELSSNDKELFEVLMNRASVCKSVPESVFNKASTGAEDFAKLIQLQKNKLTSNTIENPEYERYFLSYLYFSGYECYKMAGKDTEAQLMLQEAGKVVE